MFNVFPTICAGNVAESRDFYRGLFDFDVLFDSGWYVQLAGASDPTRQIGIVDRDHGSVPAAFRNRPSGVIISIELDDVDAVPVAAVAAGHEIVMEPRSEDFGQRHFMTVDPDGALVDVITQIAPDDTMSAFGLTSAPGESTR